MANTIEWIGRQIGMRCFISPRYLFLATETELSVDGTVVARTGGFSFTESCIATVQNQGKQSKMELEIRSGLFTMFNADYVLRVDGSPISSGKISIERIAAGCLVWMAIVALVAAGVWFTVSALVSR